MKIYYEEDFKYMYYYYENNEEYEVFKEYEQHGGKYLILLDLGEDFKYVELKDCKKVLNKKYEEMREAEEASKQYYEEMDKEYLAEEFRLGRY